MTLQSLAGNRCWSPVTLSPVTRHRVDRPERVEGPSPALIVPRLSRRVISLKILTAARPSPVVS